MNNNEREVAIVTIYTSENEKHSKESALAWYTKSFVFGMGDKERNKIVIFSNIKNKKKVFFDEGLEINECWRRGGLFFVWEILKEIKKYPNLKVIHIQHELNLFGGSFSSLLYLYLLKKLYKDKKVVVTYHAVILLETINKQFKEVNQLNFPVSLIKFAFSFIYKLSARYIDKAIVHEDYFKQILIKNYGFKEDRVEVIHFGIEDKKLTLSQQDARKKLKIPEDRKIVLFFGFLAGYKGIDLLLDAFQLLDDKQYYLILAGGKPKRVAEDVKYNEWYDSMERRIGQVPNILKVEFVPEEQTELYFSASDVLVSPYLQMFGPSGPITLAISYSKPFLASDVFKGIYENDKVFFKRNKESLKLAIEIFFNNRDFLNGYIWKMKKERSCNIIGQQTFNLYQKYLQKSI